MNQLQRTLLRDYTPLVRRIAGGFMRKLPSNVLVEDLVAAGMAGLWDAVRRNPQELPDNSFEWYARVRIRGAIVDELRAQDWLPRRARVNAAQGNEATPFVVRVEDLETWEWEKYQLSIAGDVLENAVDVQTKLEQVAVYLHRLPERTQLIFRRHYFEGVKFKHIAAELGVSEPRVSQLHSRGILKLQEFAGVANDLTSPKRRASM